MSDELRNVAIQAAKEAGKLIRENFGHVKDVRVKHGNWRDLVTNIDLKANEIILEMLRKEFPDHGIISEEAKPIKGEDYLWYVDPLDGTTNYTMAFPFSATCIGLLFKGKPILGIVYNPIIDEMFVGQDGKGATLNGQKIRVSGNDDLKKTMVTFCHDNTENGLKTVNSFFMHFKTNARDYRKLGSGNLEICYVGCGRNDVYFRPDVIPHDIVPGYVILKEAGGKATDWEGKPWVLESKDLLVTNGTKIHQDVLDVISRR